MQTEQCRGMVFWPTLYNSVVATDEIIRSYKRTKWSCEWRKCKL